MSKLVFAEWQPLKVVRTAARASFHVMTRTIAATNALYETLVSAPAPAKGSQSIAHHDHTSFGGGLPIHRGLVYCMDYGQEAHPSGFSRSIDVTETGSKVPFLVASAPSSVPWRAEADFFAYITRGMSRTKTNRASATPVLEGKFIVYNSGVTGSGTTATVYLKHLDSGDEVSFTINLLGSGTDNLEEFYLQNIPINDGGGWNRYRWYINSPKTTTVSIVSAVIAETLEKTQPVSTGANEYHNATTRP